MLRLVIIDLVPLDKALTSFFYKEATVLIKSGKRNSNCVGTQTKSSASFALINKSFKYALTVFINFVSFFFFIKIFISEAGLLNL